MLILFFDKERQRKKKKKSCKLTMLSGPQSMGISAASDYPELKIMYGYIDSNIPEVFEEKTS